MFNWWSVLQKRGSQGTYNHFKITLHDILLTNIQVLYFDFRRVNSIHIFSISSMYILYIVYMLSLVFILYMYVYMPI